MNALLDQLKNKLIKNDPTNIPLEWWGSVICGPREITSPAELMAKYAHSLQGLPKSIPVLICIEDPIEALGAFYGALAIGLAAGMVDSEDTEAMRELDVHVVDKVETNKIDPKTMPISTKPNKIITFTSGSTGAPKAIFRKPSSWIYSFIGQGIEGGENVAILGKLSHSLSLYAAVEALHEGARLHILSTTNARQQIQDIGSSEIDTIYATPTQMRLLRSETPLEHVTRIFVGGGPFPAADKMRAEALFPNAKVIHFYGTSETSFISICDENSPAGSVGRPYPGVSIEIKQDKVMVKTPAAFSHYLGERARDYTKTYIDTGELGRLDQDGNLFLEGRADRRVTVADKTVHLDEIETALRGISGVEEAAVIALEDDVRGMRAFGAVKLANGLDRFDMNVKGMPKRVIVLENWPQLSSGKTDYLIIEEIIKDRIS